MARELSRLEKWFLDIGFEHFPNHVLTLRVWDARGTVAYHCGTCNKDHYVDLTQEEKNFLDGVNSLNRDRPYTL